MPSHQILAKDIAYRKLQRMTYEMVEQNMTSKQILLAGIKGNGLIIAHILAGFLKEIYKGEVLIIEIMIDKKKPKNISLSLQMDFDDKIIIITDDVTNTGRTLLYAIKPFLTFYPKKIQTLVLVERSYKEFPVTPDYVGLSVSTALTEKIVVETSGGEIEGASLTEHT